MTSASWAGVLPALATPFGDDGKIDEAQLAALIDLLLSEGVSGFVVSGSTGEYYSMSASERVALFEAVARHTAGRCLLVAGTSAINHAETLQLTQSAKDIGYDGCMVLPPVYCLPKPAEIVQAFRDVAAIGLPIMVYNNPARVGVELSPELATEIAGIPGVVAYKESSKDIYAMAKLYYATRDHIAHFAGLEPYGSALLSRGAKGIVSTISNVCGREVVGYYRAFQAGDAAALSRHQQVIDEMYHLLAQSGLSNFAFVKSAMAALGRPGGKVRAPHIMASQDQIDTIGKKIKDIYERADIPLASS